MMQDIILSSYDLGLFVGILFFIFIIILIIEYEEIFIRRLCLKLGLICY